MITVEQIHGFVRGLPESALLTTLERPRHFRVELHGTTIICFREKDELGKITQRDLVKYLEYANFFSAENRFKPSEYPSNLRSNSYFVAILKGAIDAAGRYELHLPEECAEAGQYVEGATETIVVNRYERDKDARAKCIAIHGAICAVCRVPMSELYGPEAAGLIHIHHRTALAAIGKEYVVDPEHDLVPVCPNCHAFIHWNRRMNEPRTIDEVRHLIEARRRQSSKSG